MKFFMTVILIANVIIAALFGFFNIILDGQNFYEKYKKVAIVYLMYCFLYIVVFASFKCVLEW